MIFGQSTAVFFGEYECVLDQEQITRMGPPMESNSANLKHAALFMDIIFINGDEWYLDLSPSEH